MEGGKMKKILAALAAFCCLVSCAVPAVAAAAEETEVKISPDAVVRDAIEELEETDEFRFEKRALYDLSLEETGFLYDIEIGDRRGFLVLLETESGYEVAEYYADAENPYKDARRPVYGGFLNYLEIIGNFFYDAVTGKPVARLYGDFNVSAGSRTQKIEYSKKSEASYKISRGLPSYMQTSYENSCANIAGGIVVGYYDSFYDDLLPAYTAYSGGRWTAESSATRNLIDTLYYDMKTNVYGGTTYENFKTGLSAYVTRRGRNVSYSSLASGNTLNFSAFESTVKNGKPVVLFVDRYNAISSIAQANGYDMLKEENDGIYMDQSCVRTDLSMPLLSEETGVFFPDAVEGYSVSSTALYYDRETDATLSVAVEYQAEDGTKFLVSIAVDKRCAEYITDYSWFNEATEPTRLGDKTVMVSVFGTVVAMRYETDERYVGFRFDATEKEVALRIADEIING